MSPLYMFQRTGKFTSNLCIESSYGKFPFCRYNSTPLNGLGRAGGCREAVTGAGASVAKWGGTWMDHTLPPV